MGTPKITHAQQEHCSRRRVHFNEGANTYHTSASAQLTITERVDLWHSAADMKLFKGQTSCFAREVYRAEQANPSPTSYQRVVLATYDACCRTPAETLASPLTTPERKLLRKWTHVATSRVGLERTCIRDIARDRSARRRHVVDTVLDLQESLNFRPDTEEILRKASESISRASRLFAREMAQAHAEGW